ncbi:MAG: glycosyltransferase [Cloacibacterium sp.]|nr:glycosyltransferase [Cloacibacterium sp.]
MPFFSIVIPLFNKENYIENTLKSIFNQEFTDYEVIVVNDCSTDKSPEKAKNMGNEKITIIHHNENKGLSAARNTGIRNSKAEYIAFLDADDVWKPSFLKTISEMILRFPDAEVFATNYEEIYPNQRILPKNKLKKNKEKYSIIPFFEYGTSQPVYIPSSVCVKKNVFEKTGYYDEEISYGEDIDFNIRLNLNHQLAYTPEALVEYTMYSENQITNTKLGNKGIPDFNKYEEYCSKKNKLKKYLDFNRYIFAKLYKVEKNEEKRKKIIQEISLKNLNIIQIILLYLPISILKKIQFLKMYFLRKGIKIATYT